MQRKYDICYTSFACYFLQNKILLVDLSARRVYPMSRLSWIPKTLPLNDGSKIEWLIVIQRPLYTVYLFHWFRESCLEVLYRITVLNISRKLTGTYWWRNLFFTQNGEEFNVTVNGLTKKFFKTFWNSFFYQNTSKWPRLVSSETVVYRCSKIVLLKISKKFEGKFPLLITVLSNL